MDENIKKPVIPLHRFRTRLMRSLLLGAAMIAISLAIGMVGFLHYFPKMDWADAFVNASMLLAGMGRWRSLTPPVQNCFRVFTRCFQASC